MPADPGARGVAHHVERAVTPFTGLAHLFS